MTPFSLLSLARVVGAVVAQTVGEAPCAPGYFLLYRQVLISARRHDPPGNLQGPQHQLLDLCLGSSGPLGLPYSLLQVLDELDVRGLQGVFARDLLSPLLELPELLG